MTTLAGLIPEIGMLRSLMPEEVAFHLLSIVRASMRNGLVALESLRAYGGVSLGAIPSWGYGPQNEEEADLIVTEAWRWLEFNLFILPAPGMNGSNGFFVLGRRARQIVEQQSFDQYRRAVAFPRGLLHPAIADAIWPALLRGELDVAVFVAFRAVEEAVRKAAKFANEEIGVALMRKAFDANKGPLRRESEPLAEREALANLFAGSIGSYKNPRSHRTVGIPDPGEAQEMVMLASHLLRIVETRCATKP